MASEQPEAALCSQDGCIGVRLPATVWCLTHAAEQAPDAFDAELNASAQRARSMRAG